MSLTDSNSPSRGRWKVVALVVVGVLLGAELAARVIEPMVPSTQGWPSAQMASKVDQMMDLAAKSIDIDVVFLGSSSMDQALNPISFNTNDAGLVAYNASFNGASLRSMELWAQEVVVPTLNPELVVLGLTTRELNDEGRTHGALFEQLASSTGLRRHVGTETMNPMILAEDLSALLRIRTALRKPYTFGLRLLGRNDGEVVSLPGPFGLRVPEDRDFSYDFGDQWRDEWRSEDMLNFTMGGVEFETLERMVDELTSQGRRVVLIPLPVSPDYALVQPGGAASMSEFRALLSNVANSHGQELIEPLVEFKSDAFRDPAHLGPVAAEEFSIMVAGELAALTMQASGDSSGR